MVHGAKLSVPITGSFRFSAPPNDRPRYVGELELLIGQIFKNFPLSQPFSRLIWTELVSANNYSGGVDACDSD